MSDIIDSDILEQWFAARSGVAQLQQRALKNVCHYFPASATDTQSPEKVQFMKELGLDTEILNYINSFVQSWAGILNQQKSSPIWTDNENDQVETSDVIAAMMTAYDSDRYLYSYDKAVSDFIINSMIFMGVMEIKIDKSPSEPLGRILFENHPIGTVWFDADVKGTDIAKESKFAFKEYHLSIKSLIYDFPEKEDALKYHQQKLYVDGNLQHSTPDSLNMLGSKYGVTEFNYIERKKVKRLFTKSGIRLPDFNNDTKTNDHREEVQNWLANAGENDVVERFEATEVLKTATFCPGLSLSLDDRVDQRQIKEKGRVRLPYYTMSFETCDGIPIGIPDLVFRCQKTINDHETRKEIVFSKTPFGGKQVYHPAFYDNDEAQKQKLLNADPTEPLFMSPKAPIGAKLWDNIPPPNINPQIFADQSQHVEAIKDVIRLTPALMGDFGKSKETGILHAGKVEEGLAVNGIAISNFHEIQRDWLKGWLQSALTTYKGTTDKEKLANIDRKFRSPKGDNVTLNEFTGFDDKNKPVLKNDLGKIKYQNIITTLDTNNTSTKARKREINFSMMSTIPATPYNAVQKIFVETDLVMSLDSITPEQKEKMTEASKLSSNLAVNELLLATRTTELNMAKVETEFKLLTNPLPPEPQSGGQSGGGQQQTSNTQLKSNYGGGTKR